MRLSRFARTKRQTTPFLWGWSVFTFNGSGIPTLTYGIMRAAGLQFNPYRESVGIAPFYFPGSTTYRRPYIAFISKSTSPSPSVGNTAITSVTTGGAYGYGTTVTQSSTSLFVKQTKNKVQVDQFLKSSPATIDTTSVECALGRL